MDIQKIKQLRAKTKASVSDCRRALDESGGDIEKAEILIRTWGRAKAAKKGDRKTEVGVVEAYIHSNATVGSLISLACETDFVARTEEFKHLAHELAMQITAMNPETLDSLLKQPYIRDPQKTVTELISETIAKLGENIRIVSFTRHAF